MQPPPGTPRCLEASAAAALSSTKSTQQRRQPGLPTPHRPSDQPTAAPGETPSDFVPACRTLCAVANVQAVQTGPTAAAVLPNGHDRSILCVDVHPSKKYCATGSADGGIRVFALPGGEAEGSLVCELYGASGGHSDWVTSCAYCEDGVSQVLVRGMRGASCGYDGTLRLWSLVRGRQLLELPAVDVGEPGALGALSPLLQVVWLNAFAAAGSKKGAITAWDLNAGEIVAQTPSAHRGAVGDLQLLLPLAARREEAPISGCGGGFVPLLASGGRADGRLCVFDLRCLPSPVSSAQAHAASINTLLPLGGGGGALAASTLCTLGADGCCKLWDLRCVKAAKNGGRRGPPSGGGAPSDCCRPVASVNAGRGGLLCGAPLDDCAGLVCAGAADGALYLLDMMAGQRGVQGGGPLSRQRVPSGAAACWGYGCSSRGAVQTVRTVEKMPSEGGDGIATTSAILAGGDDGHLACLELG
ncbi:wd g-beta repeat-containing protein [Cyclospora cayetanensis]|uniref:Wd g-beta repeat-containing protein n=1 Tax=Cyclospora cayetanensis TaxID=88456 RepID=A0A1D3CRA7_9EIME|nr:wd g-beta repeat-containing protein [Cyclospora cayetanensis]